MWCCTEQACWSYAKDVASDVARHEKGPVGYTVYAVFLERPKTGAGSPVGQPGQPSHDFVYRCRSVPAVSLYAHAVLWEHAPTLAYDCAATSLTCKWLALQAQAALWDERADPVRQQLKQLQWELRGTHAAVRALEQQVRDACKLQGLHHGGTGKPALHVCAHSAQSP